MKVFFHAADHEQLLEKLGRLGQGIEFPPVRPAGDQEIPRPFRRGAGEQGGFHLDKACLIQKTARALGQCVAQTQVGRKTRPAQIQAAMLQTQIFRRVQALVQHKGRGTRGVEQFPGCDHHLYVPGAHIGVAHAFRPGAHITPGGQHILGAQHMRPGVRLGRGLGAENNLGQPFPVAQVHKDQPAVIPAELHPAHEADVIPVIDAV